MRHDDILISTYELLGTSSFFRSSCLNTKVLMSWWKERAVREITVGDNISDKRYSIDKSIRGAWSLRIFNVSIRDSGVYICQINSKLLRERFISLTVTARRPAMSKLSSSDVLVKDEAIHPELGSEHIKQESSWKPFLSVLNYELTGTRTTSAASFFSIDFLYFYLSSICLLIL
uniref:Ig-like domain-containing protein n=1 Tax=Mesocestoides corti TaxID=53468 RepID=A0A5K3EJR1_MESCO